MELFLHSQTNDLVIIDIDEGTTATAVAAQVREPDARLFMQDQDVPLADELALVEQGVGAGGHVFAGKHLRIDATVHFNGIARRESFAPGVRVKRVFDWAAGKHGFALDAEQRTDHTLALTGTQELADLRRHIGEYADTVGQVSFDLVRKRGFAG